MGNTPTPLVCPKCRRANCRIVHAYTYAGVDRDDSYCGACGASWPIKPERNLLAPGVVPFPGRAGTAGGRGPAEPDAGAERDHDDTPGGVS